MFTGLGSRCEAASLDGDAVEYHLHANNLLEVGRGHELVNLRIRVDEVGRSPPLALAVLGALEPGKNMFR